MPERYTTEFLKKNFAPLPIAEPKHKVERVKDRLIVQNVEESCVDIWMFTDNGLTLISSKKD